MGTESLHAKRRRLMVELIKGKEIATQLQTLLQKPIQDHGHVLAEDLAMQILRSFSETLSVLSSCTAPTHESAQICAVDAVGSASSSAVGKKKPVARDRRGCYKRRRTSVSWTTVSQTREDGWAWRKYGQKAILNSEYPRCYFRCTHKYQGCKATKQVQKIEDSPMYQTTYFNHHTCTDIQMPRHVIPASDPVEPNMISFQPNLITSEHHSPNPSVNDVSQVKNQGSQSDEVLSDAKSSLDALEDIWDPLITSSYQEEAGSGSLEVLDMEANQLGDIDILEYFLDETY